MLLINNVIKNSIVVWNVKNALYMKSYKLCNRNIMTSHMSCDKIVESLKMNPYYDKYQEKIAALQRVSPEEICTRWQTHKEDESEQGPANKDNRKTLIPGPPKSDIQSYSTKQHVLSDIMKIDLIKDKSSAEIKEIWEIFHKTKENTIVAVVPEHKYQMIQNKSKKYPIFLLPLPRNQGYEYIVLQFARNEVHFTPLISYQAHKENAPECLALIYYTELLNDKKIVLMRGEYDNNIINVIEAQCLANQLQLFYGEDNEKRTKIMDRFTFYPDEFKHMDLIAELECLSL